MSHSNVQDMVRKKKEETSFVFAESLKQEMKILSMIWIKISMQSSLSLIPKVLGSMFVGNLENTKSALLLSAVGLGSNFSDITGMTIGWGFTSGLLTLIPQCIGSNRIDLISEYVQRAFYISSFVLIISTILQFYSGTILCSILNYYNTPNEMICDYITMYCIYLIPFLYFITWFAILKRILQNLRYNSQLLVIIFISNIATPFWNWLFIYYLDIGYLGAAITINMDAFCNVFFSALFLWYKGYGFIFKPIPIGMIMKWNEVKQYLKLTIPGFFSVCSSWWIGELVIILSGFIANPTISVASMVICYSVYEVLLWIGVGLGNSVNIRIGKYIGFGSTKYAKNVVKIATFLNLLFIITFSLFLTLLNDYIPKLYSNNIDVIQQSSKLMHYIDLVLVAASIYRILNGTFYGLGLPMTVAIILFIAQDIIALSLIFISLFALDYKVYTDLALQMVWIFIACGFFIASLGLSIVLLYKNKTIWKAAVFDSQMRIKAAQQIKPLVQDKNQSSKYGSVQ